MVNFYCLARQFSIKVSSYSFVSTLHSPYLLNSVNSGGLSGYPLSAGKTTPAGKSRASPGPNGCIKR